MELFRLGASVTNCIDHHYFGHKVSIGGYDGYRKIKGFMKFDAAGFAFRHNYLGNLSDCFAFVEGYIADYKCLNSNLVAFQPYMLIINPKEYHYTTLYH